MVRVVAALPVPEPPKGEKLEEKGGKSHNSHTPALTVRQRHGKLFDELDLSGLYLWTPDLADTTHQLLAKYHDVFLLDPAELGCTHSTEHIINVTDDTPFKERFRQIPPPMVEEVRNHLKEMVESGAIRPSQSAWCNAMVLVQKKDGGLHFCIDFHCLNTLTEKDSYPLPRIQEVLESLVGAGHFSYLDPQIWILADKDGRDVKAIYHLHSRQCGGLSNVIRCLLGSLMPQLLFNDLCGIVWVS